MIDVQHLTKRYGKIVAVDDLSFSIEPGQILGLLGPNGAGKSTTMNILTGYLSSTEGRVFIGGVDILENPIEAKRKIGYLPEQPPLYMEMTVTEYLSFICDLKGMKRNIPEHIEEVCKLVKIDHVAKRLIKNLSKGYRQRVGLAQALINSPDLLVLDEPTVGLDPKEIIEIRNLIKFIGRNHTVILSSHILSEVQAVSDRVVVINKGKLLANDTPANLAKNLVQRNKLLLRIAGPEQEVFKALSGIDGVRKVVRQGSKEQNTFDFVLEGTEGKDLRYPVFSMLASKNWPLLSSRGSEVSLEDIFLELTSDAPDKGGNA